MKIDMYSFVFSENPAIYTIILVKKGGSDEMRALGMRMVIEKNSDAFNLVVPAWIGERMGNLLLMQFDGERLTIAPAEGLD
jgi:hypothetical protein